MLPLLIIIKFKTIHADSISLLDSRFLQVIQNSAVLQETLEESESLLGIQIGISQHFFNLWTFHNEGVRIILVHFHCVGQILCDENILREEFLFKGHRLLFHGIEKTLYIIQKLLHTLAAYR